MESLWRKQAGDLNAGSNWRQPLTKDGCRDIYWDVIVIGAGLAGLLTAYYLQEMGKQVLVLEAKKVASGQTGRTTAKITSQHGLKYTSLEKSVGEEKARLYAQANEMAIREYEQLIHRNGIECDFKRVPSCLYTVQEENTNILKEEAAMAKSFGIDASFATETELPFPVKGAVRFQNQAQLSPLEFACFLASKLNLLEHTKVLNVKGHQVITEQEAFEADKIVVATHYPIFNLPGFYFLRQHQERSYVLALSGCPEMKGMYYGIDKTGLSFRQAGDYLLLGGSSHRTGKNENGNAYDSLRAAANEYFPESKEITCWSAQDCMPHDGIPFIGSYSMLTPNLYVATGFQKWGMTSSMIAAMVFRDEICEIENYYAKLFSPQRLNFAASTENLLSDISESARGLSKGFFHRPKRTEYSLPNGHGGIVTVDGQRYACYRDEEGKFHEIPARCPHMGCELTWNPDEKSWDCPCHGSRFDVDGKLLDNPAKQPCLALPESEKKKE